jgi:hypothetical protein
VYVLDPLAESIFIMKHIEQMLNWCNGLELQLRSAKEERKRLVEPVLMWVGS